MTHEAFTTPQERPIVYVRKVQVDELPDDLRAQASGAGLKELYAIGSEAGEQLALVKDREMAFIVARQHDYMPVSAH